MHRIIARLLSLSPALGLVAILVACAPGEEDARPRVDPGAELHEAVQRGDLAAAGKLMKAGADPSAADGNSWTPLHHAVKAGNEDMVEYLCRWSADPDAVTAGPQIERDADELEFGTKIRRTPMHFVSDHARTPQENEKMLAAIGRCDPDMEVTDELGRTPLVKAAFAGNSFLVAKLLDAGASYQPMIGENFELMRRALESRRLVLSRRGADGSPIEKELSSYEAENYQYILHNLHRHSRSDEEGPPAESALRDAVAAGDAAGVRDLLESKGTPGVESFELNKLLRLSVEGEHVEVARALLEFGADAGCRKCLTGAIRSNNDELFALVLGRIEVGRFELDNNGLLTEAVAANNLPAALALIAKSAGVNVIVANRISPLRKAIDTDRVRFVGPLLDHGAEVKEEDLRQVAKQGNTAILTLFLQRGLDPNSVKPALLSLAVHGGHLKMVRLLLDRGAHPEGTTDRGELQLQDGFDLAGRVGYSTALMAACARQHGEIARLLIKKGADVNAKDIEGRTALHIAARRGDHRTVRALVEAGAELHARTNGNRTPTNLANHAMENGPFKSRRLKPYEHLRVPLKKSDTRKTYRYLVSKGGDSWGL